MIRQAVPADIDGILRLGIECHAAAVTKIPVEPVYARRTIAMFVHGQQYFAWVKVAGDEVIACLLGHLDPVWYNPAVKQGSDLLFYGRESDPRAVGAGRMLLKRFKQWGFGRGAQELVMAVSFGGVKGRRTGKIYEKEWFEYVGGLYILRAEDCHERTRKVR